MTEDSYNRTNINILKVFPSFILGYCRCGCGNPLDSLRTKNRPHYLKFYLQYHNRKPKTNKLEYRRVYRPDHPNADAKGCVRYHRLVMEEKLGRYLEPWEIVDHINMDRQDNRPENLRLFSSNSTHITYHKTIIDIFDRMCSDPECKNPKNDKIKMANGRPKWYGDKERGFKCFICWKREMRRSRKISY